MYEGEVEQKQIDYRKASAALQRGYPLGVGGDQRTATAVAPTMAPITGRVDELARHIEELHQCIGMLEQRLVMALTPDAPKAVQTPGGERDRSDNTQLGATIAELSAKVRNAIYRINDLTQRVEL